MKANKFQGGTLKLKHKSENRFDITNLFDEPTNQNGNPGQPSDKKNDYQKNIMRDRNNTLIPRDSKTEAYFQVHFKMCQEIKEKGKSKLRKVPMRYSIGGTPLKEGEVEKPPPTILNYSSVVVSDSSDDQDDFDEEFSF